MKMAAVLGLTPVAPVAGRRPVVFVGPYEHHSNELPWRESGAEVVAIPADADGRIDLAALENALRSVRTVHCGSARSRPRPM